MINKLIFLNMLVLTLSACGGASQDPFLTDDPVVPETPVDPETPPAEETPVKPPVEETPPVSPPPALDPIDPTENPTAVERPDNLSSEELALIQSLENVNDHLTGINGLSNEALIQEKVKINSSLSMFESNTYLVQLAFETVELYDDTRGAMFTNGSATDGGISSRTENRNQLEYLMLEIMQGIFDNAYNEANLNNSPLFYNNRKLETSSFFPGAVDVLPSEYDTCNIQVNGTHVRGFGIPANYETLDARRPTGCYLAPGSISRVSVPESLVGIGASVLVGAHTWDLTEKPRIARMDRVSKLYDITESTITIANPLGGGIYINIPYEQDLGILDITIDNAVRSPYFSNTVANKTSQEQWENEERNHPAPFADFESDKVMMQVPSSWIYALDDPANMMADWDLSMDGVSELFSRPLIRPKTVVYAQIDVIIRGTANHPGYPQSNITYDPDRDYGGNHNNVLVTGPRGTSGSVPSVFFHELGHAENFNKFTNTAEAEVNFLWVAAQNKKFGVELNEAFSTSRDTPTHTIEEAAQSWMITENFRMGNPMGILGGHRHEFSYQSRGYAKYADIVRLFGWEALEQFHHNANIDYENGARPSYRSHVPWDIQSLGLSIGANYDLRPLLHFWGIHPKNPEEMQLSIDINELKPSAAIYDQLMSYKTIVPQDNDAFKTLGLADFGRNAIVNHTDNYDYKPSSYYAGFFNAWWDEYNNSHARLAEQQVQAIIDLYFPNGRPAEIESRQ